MATSYPLVRKFGRNQELQPGDMLLSQPTWLDIVGYQSAVVTTLLTDFTVPGSDFVWNEAYAAGRKVYLEILGGATVIGGMSAQLYTLAGVAITGTATVSGAANANTRGRSTALTLVHGTTYQLHMRPTPGGITAQLRLARLIIE
jgi:hypothetical protein